MIQMKQFDSKIAKKQKQCRFVWKSGNVIVNRILL